MALNEIKKKIKSIQKTAQITNAMRLVSTTKYNQIVTESMNYDRYARQVKSMVSNLIKPEMLYDVKNTSSSNSEDTSINYHAMMQSREVKKRGFLVITADKGLAGNYNSGIIKTFSSFIDQFDKSEVEVLAIGRPIVKFCQKENLNLAYECYHLSDYPSFTEVKNIIKKTVKFFQDGTYDELYLVYNFPVNVLITEQRLEKILPISQENISDIKEHHGSIDPQVIIEPNIDDVLDEILPLYVETQIYGAIIDAKTAEQASRMQAMGQATDNAEKLINELQQSYHHERQKRITNEIIEIVSGANAQENEGRV